MKGFSGGKVFRPDRCRLKDETFERLVMIRCNNEVPSPVVKNNNNIRNNILLKTEQNSSQAHHIKRRNQNLEDKHCRFR